MRVPLGGLVKLNLSVLRRSESRKPVIIAAYRVFLSHPPFDFSSDPSYHV